MKKVYAFIHTYCIYESAFAVKSLHKTKAGAYRSMRDWLEENYAEWREEGLLFGKQKFKFGTHEAWMIRAIELKD